MTDAIADTILALCTERGPGKTICPTDAAKSIASQTGGDATAWRGELTGVRQVAFALAREGRIVIYRKGKPIDPDSARGVIRIGLPRQE